MTTLLSLSDELAEAVERVSGAVVAVNARLRLASSGVHWRPGVIVTADHSGGYPDTEFETGFSMLSVSCLVSLGAAECSLTASAADRRACWSRHNHFFSDVLPSPDSVLRF